MKKIVLFLLTGIMCLSLFGCSSGGVSQSEYDAVVAELEELKQSLAQGQTESESESMASTSLANTKDAFDAQAVIDSLQIEAYQWVSSIKYSQLALEIKNASQADIELSINVTFKNADGSMVGSQEREILAFPAGDTTILIFSNEEPFETFDYEITVVEVDWFKPITQNISYEKSQTDTKVVLKVTNNGEVAAQFLEVTALFFKDNQPVGSDHTYCVDSDSELKPQKSKTVELNNYKDYDEVKIGIVGRGE